MLKNLLVAAGFIVSAVGAQAAMPEASDAAAQAGSFLKIAADAGQQVASVVNGEAAASNDAESPNLANTVTAPAIPEPETYALMLAGLAAVGFGFETSRSTLLGVGARRHGGRGWPPAPAAYAGAAERRTELGLAAASMRLRTAAPTTASVRRAASPRERSRSPMSDL